MYYDLNISLTPTLHTKWSEFLKELLDYRYTSIAIDRIYESKVPPTIPSLPELMITSSGHDVKDTLKIYSRITVILDDPSTNFGLASNNPSLKDVHIVAVRPTSEKMFQLACTHLDIDVISLNMEEKLPFLLKNTMVSTAIKRGIYFELIYAQALSDQASRRNFMVNALSLISVTKGKNILLTSGASDVISLRGPHDMINLVTCMGIKSNLANRVLLENPRSLLYHAATRKFTFNAMASLEPKQEHPLVKEEKTDPLAVHFISF